MTRRTAPLWWLARALLTVVIALPAAIVGTVCIEVCMAVDWLIERGDARWGAAKDNVGD